MSRLGIVRMTWLLAAALAAFAPVAAQEAESPETFGEEISVTAIEVPVQVLVGGEPVRGLGRQRFELFVDGERRELSGFEVVDLGSPESGERLEASPAGMEAAAGAPARRSILFLFDLVFADLGGLRRALADTRTIVTSRLGPSDRAAIALYAGRGAARIVVPFTADGERLAAGLDLAAALLSRRKAELAAAKRELAARAPSPAATGDLAALSSEVGPSAALVASATAGFLTASELEMMTAASDEGRFAEVSSNPVLTSLAAADPGELAAELAQSALAASVASQLAGIAELLTLLRDVPGQKHLAFYSRGFRPSLITEHDSLERAAVLGAMQRFMAACREARWAVQAVDLAGVPPPDEPGFAAEGLFAIADGSGGRLYENYNEFDEAAERMLLATSVTYVLVFQREGPADGSFHRIDVRVRDAPPGARVVHRDGYDAPRPRNERSALERQLDRAATLLGDRELADLETSAVAFGWPGVGGVWRISTIVDVAAASLELAAAGENELALEVGGYALDADRRVRGSFSRGVRLDLGRVGPALGRRGLRVAGELELPPGDYRLRFLVHDPRSGRTALRTVPLAVGPLMIWPPLVEESGWLSLPQAAGGTHASAPGPAAGRARWTPLSNAVFTAGSEIEVALVAAGTARPLRLTARVVDAAGRALDPVPLGPIRELERADGFVRCAARLSTAGLAPGDYRLELEALEPSSGSRVGRADRFAVR
jgi:VWFA-related protein